MRRIRDGSAFFRSTCLATAATRPEVPKKSPAVRYSPAMAVSTAEAPRQNA